MKVLDTEALMGEANPCSNEPIVWFNLLQMGIITILMGVKKERNSVNEVISCLENEWDGWSVFGSGRIICRLRKERRKKMDELVNLFFQIEKIIQENRNSIKKTKHKNHDKKIQINLSFCNHW